MIDAATAALAAEGPVAAMPLAIVVVDAPVGHETVAPAMSPHAHAGDPADGRAVALARARAILPAGARSRGRAYAIASRALDLAVCVFLAPVVLLVGLVIAAAITILDGGPVLFTQQRTGLHGRRFTMYKFRTMVPDAEAMKDGLASQSVVSYPVFKVRNDPRITRSGAFLRRTFLDELPQLINVVKGDMGIVGPRPTSAPPADYALWQTARLEGRPGLTGLWQTTPDSESLEFSERVRLDIAYLRGRSVGGDVRLIGRTVRGCMERAGH